MAYKIGLARLVLGMFVLGLSSFAKGADDFWEGLPELDEKVSGVDPDLGTPFAVFMRDEPEVYGLPWGDVEADSEVVPQERTGVIQARVAEVQPLTSVVMATVAASPFVVAPVLMAPDVVFCKCSKGCKKAYCPCIKSGKVCGPSCKHPNIKCHNNGSSAEVESFRKSFQGQTFCRCKQSHCEKRYCLCFQAGVPCSESCQCRDCANPPS